MTLVLSSPGGTFCLLAAKEKVAASCSGMLTFKSTHVSTVISPKLKLNKAASLLCYKAAYSDLWPLTSTRHQTCILFSPEFKPFTQLKDPEASRRMQSRGKREREKKKKGANTIIRCPQTSGQIYEPSALLFQLESSHAASGGGGSYV